MKNLIKTALTLAVLASAGNAMAESVDLTVTGTLIPPACTPALSGAGNVDYGTIKAGDLKADDYNVLEAKQLDFTITCDAKAKIAVKAVNGRLASAAGVTEGASGAGAAPAGVQLFGEDSVPVVGLGLDGTAKIGGYAVRLSGLTADGADRDAISSTDQATWVASADGSLYDASDVRFTSFATTGTTVPAALTTLAGKLDVQAYINKTSELDTKKPIALDGLTTIEIVYL